MPQKATEVNSETKYRTTNFNQIIGIAEKLITSLAKKVQKVEDTLK